MNAHTPAIRIHTYGLDGAHTAESCLRDDECSFAMPLSRGTVRCLRNGQPYYQGALQPGMLRWGMPGELYLDYLTPAPNPVRFIEVIIPGGELRRAFRDAGFLWPSRPLAFEPLLQPSRALSSLASAFSMAGHSAPGPGQDYIHGLTRSLIACLIGSPHFHSRFPRRAYKRTFTEAEWKRCRDYADSRVSSGLTLTSWAALLGMRVGEFNRAFLHRTGQSPYAWFLDRRIHYAQHMLRHTVLPLVEVALRTGFSSQSHFTETFRRRVGCSPARWKALHASCHPFLIN